MTNNDEELKPCAEPSEQSRHSEDDKFIALLSQIEEKYSNKGLSADYEREKKLLERELRKVNENFHGRYEIISALDVGSTAIVFEVEEKVQGDDDQGNRILRALKLARPITGRSDRLARVIRGEASKLYALSHENLIRVHHTGETRLQKMVFPFFIMEYVKDVGDAEKFFGVKRTLASLASVVTQVAKGLAYLHSQTPKIMHCDIKPTNILVCPDGRAMISDLGYSHYISRTPESGQTRVFFSPRYAHPDLRTIIKESGGPDDTPVTIDKNKLRPQFDLYAVGITVFELMGKFLSFYMEVPTSFTKKKYYEFLRRPLIEKIEGVDTYIWQYLWIIAARLLDGHNEDPEAIPGLNVSATVALKYQTAEDFREDARRMQNEYRLEEDVPELNPHERSLVVVAGCKVPFTPRVKRLVEHSDFKRLNRIAQLGLTSLVYPGATHTRFEHSLGTFANVCGYVRALYYGTANPLFRSIVSTRDIKATLVAGLLHDLGQYPSAHDLEEIDKKRFSHLANTIKVLRGTLGYKKSPIKNIIEEEGKTGWGIGVEEVIRIIDVGSPKTSDSLKHMVLRSIVSGPIDADRLDYLQRDSVHLGVNYGLVLDKELLLRSLTTTYRVDDESSSERISASIGISEKARVAAEAIAFARYAMFATVYWHHTVRSVKAMLKFVAQRIMQHPEKVDEFFDFVFSGRPSTQAKLFEDTQLSAPRVSSSDALMLSWLYDNGDKVCKGMIENLVSRTLYKRLYSFGYHKRDGSRTSFADAARVLSSKPWEDREKFRQEVQDGLLQQLRECGRQELAASMKDCEALILLDAPWEEGKTSELRYVFEGSFVPSTLEDSLVWRSLSSLSNESVGKFRIFVHPDFKDALARHLQLNDVEAVVSQLCESL